MLFILLYFYSVDLSMGFGLVIKTMVLRSDCLLELLREFCRIQMPRMTKGILKSEFPGRRGHR